YPRARCTPTVVRRCAAATERARGRGYRDGGESGEGERYRGGKDRGEGERCREGMGQGDGERDSEGASRRAGLLLGKAEGGSGAAVERSAVTAGAGGRERRG